MTWDQHSDYRPAADRQTESLPPYSLQAERGVLGCGLLDPAKIATAIQAGVGSRGWTATLFRALRWLLK